MRQIHNFNGTLVKFPYIPLVPTSKNKYGKPYLKFRMEKQELTKRLHKR